MSELKLDKVLGLIEEKACEDGELHEETCLLSILDYLSVIGLPGASDCYVREMKTQYPDAKISPPGPNGISQKWNSKFFSQVPGEGPKGIIVMPKPTAEDLE